MAIINVPAQGPDFSTAFLESMFKERQLQQQKEELKLREKDQKLREDAQAFQTLLQQAQIQGALAAAKFRIQQNPALEAAVGQVSPNALPSFLESLQGFRIGEAQASLGEANAEVAGATTDARIRATQAGATQASADADVAARTVEPRVQGAEATAARAASDARVAQATEDARVEGAYADLLDTQLRNNIQSQVLRGSDPANGARAVQAWIASQGQMTFGEASQAVGFTGETDIDPELRFRGASGASADVNKARGFFPLMKESNQRINNLHEAGVRLSFPAAIQKGTRMGSLDALLNAVNSPEQQQLVQAQRAFADMYRFSLSGQQSSDAERLAMLLSITEQYGDDDATIAQKRALRNTMLQVTRQRAMGTMDALTGAETALQVAERLGDDDITAAFRERVEAVREDMEKGVSVSPIPGDNSFQEVPNIVDSLIRGGGGG